MHEKRLREAGKILREFRRQAGWTGAELARRAGVAQPTVSRVENGRRVSGPGVIERILAALPIDAEEVARLRWKVQAAYAASPDRRVDSGVSLQPYMVRKLERSAVKVCGLQSAVVPRLLRTPEYAKAAGTRDLGGAGVLDDEARSFRFVVTEGALRTWPGPAEVMPGQLDHLARVSERGNVWLGVVPWSVRLEVLVPHGFTVYDDAAVSVETFTAEMTITDPDDVAAYREAFAVLERSAVVGDEARAVLDAVRGDLGKFSTVIQ